MSTPESHGANVSSEKVWAEALNLETTLEPLSEKILDRGQVVVDGLTPGLEASSQRTRDVYAGVHAAIQAFAREAHDLAGQSTALLRTIQQEDFVGQTLAYRAALRSANPGKMTGILVQAGVDAHLANLQIFSDQLKLYGGIAFLATHYPALGFHDALSVMSGEEPVYRKVAGVVLAVLKSVTLDAVGKNNPVIGPALAIAERVKSDVDKLIEQTEKTAVALDKLFAFDDALKALLQQVAESRTLILQCQREIEDLIDFSRKEKAIAMTEMSNAQ